MASFALAHQSRHALSCRSRARIATPWIVIRSPFVRAPNTLTSAGGSSRSGGGSRFVGRGVGITGRYLYKLCGDAIGADLISNPDLLLEPKWAALSIAFLWQRVKNNERMDAGDAYGAYKALNPGGSGDFFAPHLAYYRHIKGVLMQSALLAAGFDPQGVDGQIGTHTLAEIGRAHV